MADHIDIVEGAQLPVLERTIDLADMIAYAGATWDWHRLHYDPAYLAEKRVPAPVVDGQVFGAYLAEQALIAFGTRVEIRKLSFRFRSMVFAGETIACHGEVSTTEHTPSGLIVGVAQTILVGERIAVAPAFTEVMVRE